MQVLRYWEGDFCERLMALTARSSLFDPMIEQRTRVILCDVEARGPGQRAQSGNALTCLSGLAWRP